MNKPKIVFILTSISQPRCIKRVKSFINSGFEVKIYGFDRGAYNENANIDGHEIVVLGKQKNGTDYFSKLKQSYSTLNEIVKIEGKKNVIFYCFGYMTAMFVMLKKLQYIYEISDILYEKREFKYIKKIIKKIDKSIVRKSKLTVMTSKGFVYHLFGDEKPNNVIIQPNRIDSSFKNQERPQIKKFDINNLIFSFVGAIRFDTIFNFAETIGKYHVNHQFHFYGESNFSNKAIELSKTYPNIFYHGSYKNPDDLIDIYNNIDIVVSCYDVKSIGVKILDPNKLYESMYFYKPIVVSENSFLSEQVDKYGCGFSINPYSKDDISSFIDSLDGNIIQEKINNLKVIPIEEIVDDNGNAIVAYINNIILE
jgi:glycosyltransferase involved in cell wall biosynthesis